MTVVRVYRAVISNGALLLETYELLCVCVVYSTMQLIMVDELKNDYRNPVDFCQNLNRVRSNNCVCV